MCASCDCGCKPGRPDPRCTCRCRRCQEARASRYGIRKSLREVSAFADEVSKGLPSALRSSGKLSELAGSLREPNFAWQLSGNAHAHMAQRVAANQLGRAAARDVRALGPQYPASTPDAVRRSSALVAGRNMSRGKDFRIASQRVTGLAQESSHGRLVSSPAGQRYAAARQRRISRQGALTARNERSARDYGGVL